MICRGFFVPLLLLSIGIQGHNPEKDGETQVRLTWIDCILTHPQVFA